jgi:prophage regulatory protein
MSILRMPAVKAETGHRSHASIYNAIKAGLFTRPVPIGHRSVGWPDDEVKAIEASSNSWSTQK